jgi:hypothetical protein
MMWLGGLSNCPTKSPDCTYRREGGNPQSACHCHPTQCCALSVLLLSTITGVPKHASALPKVQQQLVEDLAVQLARQDESTALMLPNTAKVKG